MKKNPSLVWRMLAWFLVLALIPLGVVIIFVQRQVNQTIWNGEFQALKEQVHFFAEEVVYHLNAFSEVTQRYGSDGTNAFVLGADGTYLAHSDNRKVGTPVSRDLPPEIIKTLATGGGGTIDNIANGQIIGYEPVAGQKMVVVLIRNSRDIQDNINALDASIFLQLSVTLLITTIISGLAILTIVNPLQKLAVFADQLGSGNLDATIDIEELEGEIASLGHSLKTMGDRLRELVNTLEYRVEERTRDLNAVVSVSQQITRVLDLDTLLPQLTEQTKASFDLYQASVFLYNSKTEELLLEAGSGKTGQQMKAQAKSFHVSAHPSLVAEAARTKKPVVINNTAEEPGFFVNPLLPATQAEAVFPMLVSGELVGALDLQSETAGRFTENERQIFATLAEQIAIAVHNAQLYKEQLETAEQLRSVDKLKSQFLASMSHELRTPMNAIINFVEMVLMELVGPVNVEQKELLNQSLESSSHLLHLINDVLDISKITAGQLTLFLEKDINLREELNTVLGMVKPSIKDKPVQIVEDVDENLPLVTGDKRRLRQILLNLLSNAVKFTEKGTITVSAKWKDDHVLFAVIDTGPGISPEAQEAIFEPFVQTMDGIKQAEGSGLGLPISRSLAGAHGGKLWVESQIGEGAAFYFTLPIQQKKVDDL